MSVVLACIGHVYICSSLSHTSQGLVCSVDIPPLLTIYIVVGTLANPHVDVCFCVLKSSESVNVNLYRPARAGSVYASTALNIAGALSSLETMYMHPQNWRMQARTLHVKCRGSILVTLSIYHDALPASPCETSSILSLTALPRPSGGVLALDIHVDSSCTRFCCLVHLLAYRFGLL